MAQKKNNSNAPGLMRVHNPAPFPFALPNEKRSNMATQKKSNKKKGKGRRRNSGPKANTSAAVRQSRGVAHKSNPKRSRKRSRSRRNPFARRSNPGGVAAFVMGAGVAAVGNELANRAFALVLPAGIGSWAKVGVKLGAAFILRNNRTVNRFSGGNAQSIALVIATLAIADVVRPFVNQAEQAVRGFIPSNLLGAGTGAAQTTGQSGLAYMPQPTRPGMAGLAYIPNTSPLAQYT